MENSDTKRISRLTGILLVLQSKRMSTATMLAKKFGVSIRTIYRDIKALEQAGVPLIAEEGKGYALLEGYRIPPVMFTDQEANALITIEQIVLRNSDSSLISAYTDAVTKIKAVLLHPAKDKLELLAKRIAVSPAIQNETASRWLSTIQSALTSFRILNISYCSETGQLTTRNVEPFALYYTLQESWAVIAYCQLRRDYRMFRLDRIQRIETLGHHFAPHEMTLATYLERKVKNFPNP